MLPRFRRVGHWNPRPPAPIAACCAAVAAAADVAIGAFGARSVSGGATIGGETTGTAGSTTVPPFPLGVAACPPATTRTAVTGRSALTAVTVLFAYRRGTTGAALTAVATVARGGTRRSGDVGSA